MKILVIEDDLKTAAYIADGLIRAGHVADVAHTGPNGLHAATSLAYDVLIVDRLLPGLDGLSLVRALRSSKSAVPILFLTTMGGIHDRVDGLEAGADDYLLKPFAFSELMARLRALARRPPLSDVPTRFQVSDLEIDLLSRRVTRAGRDIALQPTEFRLLEYLMRHAGEVVTRTMLLERVWDFHFDPQTSVVETHISRLRAKIDRGHPQELILTVRGAGYVLRAPA
jgi:two-component system OmpR family response regulator